MSAVQVTEVGSVPLREVSALALLRSGGRTRLIAVGDHTPQIAMIELPTGGGEATYREGGLGIAGADWEVVDPRQFSGPQEHAPDAQLEAAACDAYGRVVLLAEEPARLHVVDLEDHALLTSVRLDVSTFEDLAVAWDADPSSRGEGLLLLTSGHVLVAKEKHPAGLVEFGPEGHEPIGVSTTTLLGEGAFEVPAAGRLVALAWWPWPRGSGLKDLSDLAAEPVGGVQVLSDQSTRMARLGLPLEPEVTPQLQVLDVLPHGLLHAGKPEGLVVLPDGSRLVACDAKKPGRALLRVPAPDELPPPIDSAPG